MSYDPEHAPEAMPTNALEQQLQQPDQFDEVAAEAAARAALLENELNAFGHIQQAHGEDLTVIEAAAEAQQNEDVQRSRDNLAHLFGEQRATAIEVEVDDEALKRSGVDTSDNNYVAKAMANNELTPGSNPEKPVEVVRPAEAAARNIREDLKQIGITEGVSELGRELTVTGGEEIATTKGAVEAIDHLAGEKILEGLTPGNKPHLSKQQTERVVDIFKNSGKMKHLARAVADMRAGRYVSEKTKQQIGGIYEHSKNHVA